MNWSEKCNGCVCEHVCQFKDIYKKGIDAILNAEIIVASGKFDVAFWNVKDCPHIAVSIKCPHMITRSRLEGAGEDAAD